MISKNEKFSTQDFSILKLNKAKRIPTQIGIFYVYNNLPESLARQGKIAIVVSKKVAKSAVERNSLKRKFYNLARKEKFEPKNFTFFPTKKFDLEDLKIALVALQKT